MNLTIKELQKYGSEMLHAVSDICEEYNVRWFMAYGSALGAIRHRGPIPWDYDIDIYVPEDDLPLFLRVMKDHLPSKYWIDYREGKGFQRSFPRIGLNGYETEILHIDVYRLGGFPTDPKEFEKFVRYSRFLFVTWKSRVIDIDHYYYDKKRRVVTKIVRTLTWFIPMKWLIEQMDKQANKIPFDEATIVASPLTTMSPKRMIDRHVFDESILVEYDGFDVRVPRNYEQYLETVFDNWKELPPIEERERQLKKTYVIRKI